MGDQEETNVDEVAEDVETGEPAAEEESAGDAEDAPTSESDEDGAATDGKESPEAEDVDEDEEPPTRKPRTKADWVAFRRGKKLERQQQAAEGQGEADDEDDDDLDIDDDDAKVIDKVVSKRLEPILKREEETELKSEINDFVADNPDFKPYVNKALKWAQHPTWKNVPTKQLMFAVAGDNLLKMGADRTKASQDKARRTGTGRGRAGSNTGGTKPVSEMTDEEFEKEVQAVKLGQSK